MIPHLSNLISINSLDNFDQLFTFNKSTQLMLIPKVYDENNPYENTYNNSYQLIIYCVSLNNDTSYKSFLGNFLNDTILLNYNSYNISLFEIENEYLNFIDIKSVSDYQFANFNINLNTKQNLILDDINVTGIYYTLPQSYTIKTENLISNFGNVFTLEAIKADYSNYNIKYSSNYMFPDSQENTYTSNNKNFTMPYTVNNEVYKVRNYTVTTLPSEKMQISYSNDNFQTKQRIKQYRNEFFDHIIPNVNNSNEIAIAYKTLPNAPYMNIDVYKNGSLNSYKLNNITSIQQIKDNTFQIVKDLILYECYFDQETISFYNFKKLENLNTYLNGNIKFHENIIKYGSNIISEYYTFSGIYSTHYQCTIYINGESYQTSKMPTGDGDYYLIQNNDYKFGFDVNQSLVYEFNNFIIFPRKKSILPISIKDTFQKKTVYNENNSVYVANRKENSIIKIDNISNIKILENDAVLISETGNSAFYKMKSNFGFEEINNNSSFIKIYNNINDIDGTISNLSLDSTNNIIYKIDKYDVDTTNDYISCNISLSIETVNYLLSNNKFINLTNVLNSYYIEQNGYIFNSINDLKNNFMSILNNNFYNDEIIISDLTNTNYNYINNVICIQDTIDKEIVAIGNNIEQLKFGYKFIKNNEIFNTLHENNNYYFKIDKFISSDGTIYNENEINYKLYNINIDSMFKIIFNVKKDIINSNDTTLLNIEYKIDDITSCENNYSITKENVYIPTITLDDTSFILSNDNTTIEISNDATTTITYDLDINFDGSVILNVDEILNIDIKLENNNLYNDIHNDNIFSSNIYNDFINITIEDGYYNKNIYHYDFIGKTFNTYKINLSNNNIFYTFGNLARKCTNQMSTQYDYSETNITNEFYGNYSLGTFYNIMEQNSSKYFIDRFIAKEAYTEPSNSNMVCDGYFIKQNDTDENLTTTNSLDVQPNNKIAHTTLIDCDIDNLISFGNTNYTSYEQSYYLLQYGVNYNILLNGVSASNQIFGASVKPPKNYNDLNYLFNVNNCNGCNLYNYDTTNNTMLSVILNKNSDSTNYLEKIYFDSTNMDLTIYENRINEYYSNGYDIYKNFDYGSPLLNDYKNKTGVIYFSDLDTASGSQTYGGNLQSNIIDFNYELSSNEITYINDNLHNILTSLYTEKRKMGSYVVDNQFSYKFIECGSYIYDIPRSFINIKFEKKFSSIFVYINNILVDEILSNDETSFISTIKNYGNYQLGNKKINIYKTKNIITKKLGLWC